MGFIRFRRSFRIVPGLKLNIGKKSLSVRAGFTGLGITSGTAGSRISAGLPGTGLGYAQKLAFERSDPTPGEPPRRGLLAATMIAVGQIAVFFLVLALIGMIIGHFRA